MKTMHLSAILVGLSSLVSAGTFPNAPHVFAYPKDPGNFQPAHPDRPHGRVCKVTPDATDSGPAILAAAHKCNRGGTVFLPPGDFVIATALDLTFLEDVDFAIWGNITFKQDLELWPTQAFQYSYQSASMFWRFGGTNVNIYGDGKGVIDGAGQFWWSAMAKNSSVMRPCLLGTDGLHHATVTGLTMLNPPGWFNLISNSTNVLVSDMTMLVGSQLTGAPAKNTDGWDIYRSSNIVIQNSKIVNTDDCVSFKPNSTQVVVQGLDCTGSHGISVGSLGQYQDETDLVEDLYIYNISMTNAGDFARIKVWPGVPPNVTGSTTGGGLGLVRNVTYENLYSVNNDHVISVSQCYYAKNQSVCNEYPSKLVIEDILFKSFAGTTSKKYDPQIGDLTCSSPDVCHNIELVGINVTPPSGKSPVFNCVNMQGSNLGNITCA
ncbi:pectin lyase fold/virulence factor [Penicillium cataractarum]|uniref:galacturonan 1,4-alpha-galacturonidase n=1 Tax=Penicillium cataractarum TaxID=2100454 RepID=A0A9W9VGZ0_9EURO|nr:pectin lyase fold/virulence factor [Penicillium cataractarum]KAJ5381833.1 pectin lyase fold/virulence factor [Penicillium cataractarum]